MGLEKQETDAKRLVSTAIVTPLTRFMPHYSQSIYNSFTSLVVIRFTHALSNRQHSHRLDRLW